MSRRDHHNNNNLPYDGKNIKTETRVAHSHEHGIQSDRATEFRVMRCFCGCTALTFEQAEHYAMMKVSTLVSHPSGKPLFQNFLRIGHRTDKSEAMQLLECHDICDKFLNDLQMISDPDAVDELLSLCPSFNWEQRINDAIENDDSNARNQAITQLLTELKRECVSSIECHQDYDRFRRELLRKIGKT